MTEPSELPAITGPSTRFPLQAPLGAQSLLPLDLRPGPVVGRLLEVGRADPFLLADLAELLDHLFRAIKVLSVDDCIAGSRFVY